MELNLKGSQGRPFYCMHGIHIGIDKMITHPQHFEA